MSIRTGLLIAILSMIIAACGGSSSPAPAPTPAPAPSPPPPNQSPSISQFTVSPAFAISQLGAFSMQAAATDPDGDTVSYTWDLGDGTTATGSSVSGKVYTGAGAITVKLTVSDANGGSVSDTRNVTVGSMTGTWLVTIQDFSRLRLELQQNGGVVTGRFTQLENGPQTPAGTTGVTDPAEPGKINAAGDIEIRYKVGRFLDFYLRGTMDQTGRKVTGGVFNSGFGGRPFTAVKQ